MVKVASLKIARKNTTNWEVN